RRADEGQALLVLLVARLLADQHHARVRVAGAEDGLRCVRPQRAVLALARFVSQLLQAFRHPPIRIRRSTEVLAMRLLLPGLVFLAFPALAQQDLSKVEIPTEKLSESVYLLTG